MYGEGAGAGIYVQRSEFITSWRIALYKNYLLFIILKLKIPPFRSAGNGTSAHAVYRFSDSSVIKHTAHNSFICMCC